MKEDAGRSTILETNKTLQTNERVKLRVEAQKAAADVVYCNTGGAP